MAGTRYLIAVDGYEDLEGMFTLTLTDLTAPPVAPPLPSAPTTVPPPAKKPFPLKKELKRCARITKKKPHRACLRKVRKRAKVASRA